MLLKELLQSGPPPSPRHPLPTPCLLPPPLPVRLRRYPFFLSGKLFHGVFHFRDTHTLVSHCLEEAESLVLPDQPF